MNRQEYERRRRSRVRRARKESREKYNIVLIGSLLIAVVLVIVLSVSKIYSVMQKKDSQAQNPKQQEQNVQPATQQAVEATPAPTPVVRDKAVALTFDDGPSRENDDNILNTLQTYGAHATFFVLGNRARVDGDILQKYIASGCEIGSHSWDHPNLKYSKWKTVQSQLKRTRNIVSKLTNGYEIQYLRPPYGAISSTMRKKIKTPMVLWSVDTLDWKSRNAKKVVSRVKKYVKDGDIILMHNIYSSTAEAVEKVVPYLQEQGYDVLTVSELMARKGKTMEPGHAYCDAD